MVTNNSINGSCIVTQFTSSGTWTKHNMTKSVSIFATSGGSGGSSGRQGLTEQSGGGAGGNSGCFIFADNAPAFVFNSSETVTIGNGGSGGAPQTSTNTDGNAGARGTTTSIGNIIALQNNTDTPGGINGVTANTVTGLNFAYYQTSTPVSNCFQGGSGQLVAGVIGASNDKNCFTGSAGGGGGGGRGASGSSQGRKGGAIVSSLDPTIVIVAGAGEGFANADPNGDNGTTFPSPSGGFMATGAGGGGGAGHKSDIGNPAGNGGNGSGYGAGGGGAGGAINGVNSGTGGNGSGGLLYIIEFL